MPITERRQRILEEELRLIQRVLEPVRSPEEPAAPSKPKTSVPPPWAPPLLLDADE